MASGSGARLSLEMLLVFGAIAAFALTPPPSPPLLAAPLRPVPPRASAPPSPETIGALTSLRITFFGLDLWSLCTWQSDVEALVNEQRTRTNVSMAYLTAPGMCYSALKALNYTTLLNTSLPVEQLMPGLDYFVADVSHKYDEDVKCPVVCVTQQVYDSQLSTGWHDESTPMPTKTAQDRPPPLAAGALPSTLQITSVLRKYFTDNSLSIGASDYCAGNRTESTFYSSTTPVNGTWATLHVMVTVSSPSPQGLTVPPTAIQLRNLQRNCDGVNCVSICFAASTRVRVKVPQSGSSPAKVLDQARSGSGSEQAAALTPRWLHTALEDLRIGTPANLAFQANSLRWRLGHTVLGSEVECLMPVGQAGVDASGSATNTAYQLGTCHVVYYTHAVRATLNQTRLTFTRADGSTGQLTATPRHRYLLPGHPVPLNRPPTLVPAAAGNHTWAGEQAEVQAGRRCLSDVAHVPGTAKTFGQVVVGDLVLLRDEGSGCLHTSTITEVESVVEYGGFTPLLTGNALLVPEGVASHTVASTAHQMGLSPLEAAFSQRLAADAAHAQEASPLSVQLPTLGPAGSQAVPVVRATVHMPGGDCAAQLTPPLAETCAGQGPSLARLFHTRPSWRLTSLDYSAAGAASLLDTAIHMPSSYPRKPAAPDQAQPTPQLTCPIIAPSLHQRGDSQQAEGITGDMLVPASDLLPLWRQCLEHWTVNASLSRTWQRTSPPLAPQLALASMGQLPLVTEPRAPDAYLDMASVPAQLQPAVRQMLGGCVQLGARMGDLPFTSPAAHVFKTLLGQMDEGSFAALSTVSVQQQASRSVLSMFDVVAMFMQSMAE
ncbi:hypothetical protein QJQ45_008047 [Haematococcus lacustris]|nr:hypothetical protein QJQ45_008047 [Haematococcus lacustris]